MLIEYQLDYWYQFVKLITHHYTWVVFFQFSKLITHHLHRVVFFQFLIIRPEWYSITSGQWYCFQTIFSFLFSGSWIRLFCCNSFEEVRSSPQTSKAVAPVCFVVVLTEYVYPRSYSHQFSLLYSLLTVVAVSWFFLLRCLTIH